MTFPEHLLREKNNFWNQNYGWKMVDPLNPLSGLLSDITSPFDKFYGELEWKRATLMDITMENAEFQEKSMIFLDYLLRIQKAHDIFNIGLDSFIYVYMSRKI